MAVNNVVSIAVGGLIAVLLQWLFFGRLMIWGAYPDVVLLYVVVIALRTGRLPGALTGFATGFFLDAVYGTWGIQIMVKTIMGFITGLVASGESGSVLRSPVRSMAVGFVVALVHNGILLLLILLQSGVRAGHLILELWIGCTVYTALVAFMASLFRRR